MKILQVIPYFCFGGAETMCENLTYAQKALGHEVVAVSLYDERTPIAQRMEAAGVRIRYLDKKLGLDVSMVPKLRRIMEEERPDVVHTHLDVIKYAVAAAKLAKVRLCVHTVHSVAEKEAEGRLQKWINGTYYRLGWSAPVALSPEVQASIAAFYGMEKEKIPVVYNGIDLSRCREKESYRLGSPIRILHIGRFDTPKNHAGLLRVFGRLHERHPDSQLWLVGDGALRLEIERQIEMLGLGEAVRLWGMQADVHQYLQAADMFLLPSVYEGNPMTLIEAMGTGLPIVATAVGGVPDMLKDGESALLTPCADEQLLTACEALLGDENLRERLGKRAKQESLRFSAEHMAREYCALYETKMK